MKKKNKNKSKRSLPEKPKALVEIVDELKKRNNIPLQITNEHFDKINKIPMEEKHKTICIGIPHMGIFHWQVIAGMLSLKVPYGYKIKYHMVGSCLIYEARESIVKFAIESECDYLFFLDSDMALPPDTIVKMINILEKTEAEMVSGTAFKRTPPFQPCFYTKLGYKQEEDITKSHPILESPIEFPNQGLMAVEGFGMACSMIDINVFKKLEAPYFYPLPRLGEDLTFCLKAKQKNVKMYVDLSIDVGHVATMPIQQDHFRECYAEYKKRNDTKPIFTQEVDNDNK